MRLLQRVRNVLDQPGSERSRLWPAGIIALALPPGLWAAAAMSGAASAAPSAKPFFKRTGLPIGLQLYTLGPDAQKDLVGTLKQVHAIGYRDIDHAVEMANDSRFGLSGYVFGQDKKVALDVATRIKSGTVNINGAMMSAYASSGGQRARGIGRERGVEGLRIYQQVSVSNIGG